MSLPKIIMIDLLNPKTYIWIDALLTRETKKAILIEFDGKKAWLPKAWIVRVKRVRNNKALKIKISEYYWNRKIIMSGSPCFFDLVQCYNSKRPHSGQDNKPLEYRSKRSNGKLKCDSRLGGMIRHYYWE